MPELSKARAEAVSPKRAAELMSVSERTILRLIHGKKLKATRLGKLYRILLTDLRRGTDTTL